MVLWYGIPPPSEKASTVVVVVVVAVSVSRSRMAIAGTGTGTGSRPQSRIENRNATSLRTSNTISSNFEHLFSENKQHAVLKTFK
jgi:hypothetical protein